MASPLLPPTKESFIGFHSPPRSTVSSKPPSPSHKTGSPSASSSNPFPKRAIPAAFGRMSSSSTESEAFSDDPASLLSYSDSHSYPAFLAHHGSPPLSPLGSPTSSHPISLLTALLNSTTGYIAVPERKDSAATASTAAPSTVPSPISSSGWHGKTAPILRRGSASASSDGTGFVLQEQHGLGFECGLEKVVEKRERVGWADGVETANAPLAPKPTRACTLKFAVTCMADKDVLAAPLRRSSATGSRPATSSFADVACFSPSAIDDAEDDEDELDEEEDEDDEDEEEEDEDDAEDDVDDEASPDNSLEAPVHITSRRSSFDDDDDEALDDDLGYQEDEEDGFTSEEEVIQPQERTSAVQRRLSTSAFIPDASQRKELKVHIALPKTPNSSPVHRHTVLAPSYNPNFPFARPTNYRRKRRQSSATPDKAPAPALVEPPPRRGRGHIQVVDGPQDKGKKAACSRHCSPPPVMREKSRSAAPPAGQSPSARKLFSRRVTSESPRKNGRRRVGSPMPPKIELEDEEDEEVDVPQSIRRAPGGWRSDDALFTPSHRPAPFQPARKASLPPTDRPSPDSFVVVEPCVIPQAGPSVQRSDSGVRSIFRRASVHIPSFRRASDEHPPQAVEPTSITPKATSATLPTSPTLIPSSYCVPAVDDTPATCTLSTSLGGTNPIAERLHRTLGTQPASVARAGSLGSKVAFAPMTSGDERSKPMACPKALKCRDDVLRWPEESTRRRRPQT